ncbi:hypothetical protein Z946_3729 [Sulfitobacter noctilucicola]|uniref:Uncharacterized protein n=1 Tax=Sulfitobacter noctilucicola TaxID=1342301 RepID=A0A7W6Q3B9_9RHOB|nr:hypothetical protein [Sulfitobacter noctilucicola]KIN64836.1 hypothetical protein Z946_3729 [Sulfitobacter noctilucicola]MBB4174020.1 hypothetical protein [Sulfitobacter noctilucicola]
MNQIINMVIRQVMNQLVRRGVNAGFDRMGRKAQPPQRAGGAQVVDENGNAVEQLTPEERRQQRHARQQARQAKQSMKAMRRITRL